MATRHSTTGAPPAFLLSKPVSSIRPAVMRGQLYFQVADVAFPTFAQAATAWSAAQPQLPLRRCEDCQLDLCRDVLRAIGSCPRWGTNRASVESRCPAFVPKDGVR